MSFAAHQNQFAVGWQAMDHDQTQDDMPPTADAYYSHAHALYLTGSRGDVTYTDAPYSTHGDNIPPSSTTSSSAWCSSGNGTVSSLYNQNSYNPVPTVSNVYSTQSGNVNGPESLRHGGTSSLLLAPELNCAAYHSSVDNMPFTQNTSIGEYPQLVYAGDSSHYPATVHNGDGHEADIGTLYSTYSGSIHAQAPSPGFGSYSPPHPLQLPPHSFIPHTAYESSMYTAIENTAVHYQSATSYAPAKLSPLSPLFPSPLCPTLVPSTCEVEYASYPSAHKTLVHTPPRNEQAPLSPDEIHAAIESSQRCTVPGCDYSTWRKPDLRRHMESHCNDNCKKFVCCGISLEKWLERCPSDEEVRAADVGEYYGQKMVVQDYYAAVILSIAAQSRNKVMAIGMVSVQQRAPSCSS
ncbi:hypothetical protein WOLCODRAFT_145446 [Wolfiporia cocos MD-104 SS10]|uniref:C2H2-type domain-containing protein n=1 Tax=Wolfiporia cocos (strain MD-104) TaxID=742152 RepID=A0A2H3IZ24_WOLCO|nr:hypothetical protein WOLCODRAFT_145446 [Wolfiporia cocos MD-104 SS10]